MPTNVNDIIRKLPPDRRKKIEARARQLICQEMTRQQLRRARARTQIQVAKRLGIKQDSVSRLEQRADMLLSTLRHYIEALGGHLSIVAEFPDQPPVMLSGIADDGEPEPARPKARRRARAFA